MTDKERLKEISNLLERYYSTEDSFEQTDLAIEIIQGHVNWIINRVEELEKENKQLKADVNAMENEIVHGNKSIEFETYRKCVRGEIDEI